MIRNCNELLGTEFRALDGAIGRLRDIYFDDRNWNIRFFVIDLSPWLQGREVLMPPCATCYSGESILQAELTMANIRQAISGGNCMPIFLRTNELPCVTHELFMEHGGQWMGTPVTLPSVISETKIHASEHDAHLRSYSTVLRYKLRAYDGEAGILDTMLIDDNAWIIRFLVSSGNNSQNKPGIIFVPHIVEYCSLSSATLLLSRDRKSFFQRPIFEPLRYLNKSYEEVLWEYSATMRNMAKQSAVFTKY